MPFSKTQINTPSLESIRKVIPDYEFMLLKIIDAVIKRYERTPGYHYVDTKLNIISGKDYPDLDDSSIDFKGKSAVFGWIQGRGLESLVGHHRWIKEGTFLNEDEKKPRLEKLAIMIEEIFHQLDKVWEKNQGHLYFMMTAEGEPFGMDDDGKRVKLEVDSKLSNVTDLFYTKGMLAGAYFLGLEDKIEEAKQYFRTFIEDVKEGRYYNDQVSFDPKNRPGPMPGRHSHGMIVLGNYALYTELLGDQEWVDAGLRLLGRIVNKYINQGQYEGLKPGDFIEYLDDQDRPWENAKGQIHSDPGHALEFIGLAAKFLIVLKGRGLNTDAEKIMYDTCQKLFPGVLLQNFENGFNQEIGGVCKAFDLKSRTPINGDMPWWPLPETLRAGAGLHYLCAGDDQESFLEIMMQCSNSFLGKYVNENVHLMAYQTLDTAGNPVDVIPATPDADPGYHTGLSIIDFFKYIKQA